MTMEGRLEEWRRKGEGVRDEKEGGRRGRKRNAGCLISATELLLRHEVKSLQNDADLVARKINDDRLCEKVKLYTNSSKEEQDELRLEAGSSHFLPSTPASPPR
jgi:hypothetical protein